MILLQHTQELSKTDWTTLKSMACEKFGGERHLDLLKRHDRITPRPKAREAPSFARKNVLFAAMKEEENGGRGD
jgi:hypothetical protein